MTPRTFLPFVSLIRKKCLMHPAILTSCTNSFQQLISASLKTSSTISNSSGLSLAHPTVQNYIQKLHESNTEDKNISRIVRTIIEKQNETQELLAMSKVNPELKEMADGDVEQVEKILRELEREFFRLIVKPDTMDHCGEVILEVSAGVGGQEAMLFTKELLEMYSSYACSKGWQCEVVGEAETDIGGIRHGSIAITGAKVFKMLKFEGGVHRVQRIPKTEKAGRIHTSASTVAILPMPGEIDVKINPQDLKIETKRASGAGGQHVNKTESAVRIVHLPSGIVVECQTERSQIQNRASAMKTLRARLYKQEMDKQTSKINSTRKLQVGFGGRNEKIRTYNFVQDRVTDHRIGLTVHNIRDFMNGGNPLEYIVTNLQEFDIQERLGEIFK